MACVSSPAVDMRTALHLQQVYTEMQDGFYSPDAATRPAPDAGGSRAEAEGQACPTRFPTALICVAWQALACRSEHDDLAAAAQVDAMLAAAGRCLDSGSPPVQALVLRHLSHTAMQQLPGTSPPACRSVHTGGGCATGLSSRSCYIKLPAVWWYAMMLLISLAAAP